MTEEILNVKNLVGCYKGTFGTIYAVDNVSFQVNNGEIVGIAGESGCGKSTLAELISGVPRPLLYYEGGEVDIRGYDVISVDKNILLSEVLTQIVGYVPQASMNSLNPVIKIRKFVLDVMKQRSTKKVTLTRQKSFSIKILIEAMDINKNTSDLDAEVSKFLSILGEKGFITRRARNEIKKMVEQIWKNEKINNLEYAPLKNLIEPLYEDFQVMDVDKGLKLVQKLGFIPDLLLEAMRYKSSFDLDKILTQLLTKCLTPSAYRKTQTVLNQILILIYKSPALVKQIPRSWWENFPQEITGIPPQKKPTNKEVLARAESHLEQLGLDPKVLDLYPHELSGGMKQRTTIGISTLFNPKLLIVDEPTSALDVTTQRKLLDLFLELQERKIVESILFISHDIPTLRQICTRGVIMYAGQLVEDSDMETIIEHPLHPYTQALIGAIVSFDPVGSVEKELHRIEGRPPDLRDPPIGCRFQPRCSKAMPICKLAEPPIYHPNLDNPKHRVKCWLYHERADEFQKGNNLDTNDYQPKRKL